MIIILFLKFRFEILLDNSLLINFVLLLTLFAYPIFDSIFVSLNRLYNGKSPLIGGIDHTSHIISRYYDSDKKCIILISSINLIYYLVVYLFFAYDLNILFNLFIIFIFYSILSFLMYIFRLQ